MRKDFKHIARVIKEARITRTHFSQGEVAHLLGLKSGQFISNVERGLCGIPTKIIPRFCELTKTDLDVITRAMVQDYQEALDADLRRHVLREARPEAAE